MGFGLPFALCIFGIVIEAVVGTVLVAWHLRHAPVDPEETHGE